MKSLRIVVLLLSVLAITPSAFAGLQQQRDVIPPDPCGDVSTPCYVGGGATSCIGVVNSYDSCTANCQCKYTENVDKCKSSPTCVDLATSEKNACLGGCVADWN